MTKIREGYQDFDYEVEIETEVETTIEVQGRDVEINVPVYLHYNTEITYKTVEIPDSEILDLLMSGASGPDRSQSFIVLFGDDTMMVGVFPQGDAYHRLQERYL